MPNASGARTQLGFIAESIWGTTPTTPTLQAIPFGTFSLKPAIDTYRADLMTADRQNRSVVLGINTASAELNTKFIPEVYDTFLESAFCSTWAANVLKVGVTPKSITFEEQHPDIARYRQGTGLICNKFSLSCKPGHVEAVFGFLGKSYTISATSVGAATLPIPNKLPITTLSAVLTEGGVTIGVIPSLDFTLEQTIDLAKPCNTSTASGYAVGMAKLTGKMNVYFENDALMTKFLAGTASSITATIGVSGGIYAFNIPNIIYTAGDSPVDKEGLLALSLDFEGVYSNADASIIVATRTL